MRKNLLTGDRNTPDGRLLLRMDTSAADKAAAVAGADDRLQRTLYVGGLDEGVTPAVLQAAFVPFGELKTVEIPSDRATGKHRGFGFVEFEEKGDADHAVENMNLSEIYGRVVVVNTARAPSRRPGEGSRPVWADDFFYRRRLAEEGMQVGDVDEEAVNRNVLDATQEK